ncbi:MAG: hypothetical protein JWQ38_2050 [Flavipsychrobacter sp.]|nr:hypothetical protein [Flavipsychrobacter sp.]
MDDLVFIKKHLRYPMSKKTLPATAFIALSLFFIFRTLWLTVLIEQRGNIWTGVFLAAMMVIAFASGVMRYWRTLKFRSIPTPYFANENIKLIDSFLRVQQLNLYRHPKAPEVFQILSRAMGNSAQREVMIFIADDKRILINSHFTNQKWLISPASKNAGQMAGQLKEWIKTQAISNPKPLKGLTHVD